MLTTRGSRSTPSLYHLLPAAFAAVLVAGLAACAEPDPELDGASDDEPLIGNVGESRQLLAGEDGNGVIPGTNQVVNAYSALASNAAAADGAITVASIAELSTAALGPVARGDLLLVIQMQGASMGTADTATGYGNITSVNNAGRYELVFAQSVAGNTISLAVPLRYSYTASGGAQVVRVPQYRSLIVPAGTSITAGDWNGIRGGVVALYVRDGITLNGAIDVSGRGFRGGAIDNQTNTGIGSLYRSGLATDGAEKGEGIAGTTAIYDLLGGRYGRGAPANGGGGGNAHNAGGGGGANGNSGNVWTGQGIMSSSVVGAAAWTLDPGYLANGNARTFSSGGGRGGYSYSANNADALTVGPTNAAWGGDNRREYGGLGGHPLANDPVAGRLFMGGGGGAGDGNNSGAGAGGDGGGIVIILADSVSGTGSITAAGEAGRNTSGSQNDAAGGGGGGGSVVVRANSITGASFTATGGAGGNQLITAAEAEGPGGGGGGGYIATSPTSIPRSAGAGLSGTTSSTGLSEFPVNGSTHGATGQVLTLGGELPFSYDADLTISVSNGITTVTPAPPSRTPSPPTSPTARRCSSPAPW